MLAQALTPSFRRTDFNRTSQTLAEFLRNDYSYILESVYPARYPNSWQERPFLPLPFTRDYAKQMAVHFRRPPSRRWVPWDSSTEIQGEGLYSSIYRTLRVNQTLKAQSERVIVQGTVLGVVLPRPDNRGWTLTLCDPYQCEVDPDPMRPLSISAAQEIRLSVPMRASHNEVQFGLLTMTPETVKMTSPTGKIYNPYRPNGEDLSNPWAGSQSPYPCWVMRYGDSPPGDFFSEINDSIFHVQTELVCAMGDAINTASWSSAGQAVLKGGNNGSPREFRRGADTVLTIGEGQDLSILSPQQAIEPYLSTIGKAMEYSRILSGLPDSPMKSRALTANAKLMERLDQDAYRSDLISSLEDAEQGLYRAIRMAYNYNYGAPRVPQLPPASVEVEYQEPPVPVDPLHSAQADSMRMDAGLVSPVEVIAKERGISTEEARSVWMRNLEDRDRARGAASDG